MPSEQCGGAVKTQMSAQAMFADPKRRISAAVADTRCLHFNKKKNFLVENTCQFFFHFQTFTTLAAGAIYCNKSEYQVSQDSVSFNPSL